jgi:hypothetical protein
MRATTGSRKEVPAAVGRSGVFYADTQGNRVIEVPGSSGTQFGIAMTAGQAYTIAGCYTGQIGLSGKLSGPATSALLAAVKGSTG